MQRLKRWHAVGRRFEEKLMVSSIEGKENLATYGMSSE